MPFTKTRCEHCKSWKVKGQTRKTSVKQVQWLKAQNLEVQNDGVLCSRCLSIYYRQSKAQTTTLRSKMNEKNNKIIVLPFPRVGKSRFCCFICKHKNTGLIIVPAKPRVSLFLEHGILVPMGVFCCKHHLLHEKFKSEAIDVFEKNFNDARNESMPEKDLVIFLKDLHSVLSKSKDSNRHLNFDSDTFSTEDFKNLTGINKEQFKDLVSRAGTIGTKLCSARQAVGMLLFKLRTGLSLQMIGTLCGLSKRYQVSRIIACAKSALITQFVPNFVGFGAVSREDVQEIHTSDLAVSLFSNFISDSVILILDCTYIYIQKSTKNKVQRRCYSMHKHRPLVKPMVIVTTTGYIMSIIGPFFADGKNNDSSILKNILDRNADGIMDWLREGDIFILDRGFRDILNSLENAGFETKSPSFLPKAEKQLPTSEANHSRLVTKIRWAVECVNGRIKSWKYFDKIVPNSDVHNIQSYLLIVAALCNCYLPPLHVNTSKDCEIAQKMLQLSGKTNYVQSRVLSDSALSHRSKAWIPINDCYESISTFPKMSEDEIRSLTFGVYQVRQAASYIEEYMCGSNSNIYFRESTSDLVHARIQSRHTSAKMYDIWVEHDGKTVTGWYCQCPIGTRTVGSCSHIASVIWFLAYARHQGYKPKGDKISPLLMDAAYE